MWNTVTIILFFLLPTSVFGQQNPFEVKNRIPRKTPAKVDSLPDLRARIDSIETSGSIPANDTGVLIDTAALTPLQDTTGIEESSIPLDDATRRDTETLEDKKGGEEGVLGDGIRERLDSIELEEPIKMTNHTLVLSICILALLLLASLLAVNRDLVRKSYRAIANDNYLRFLYREYKSMPWLYWLFYLHFAINAGLFLYLVIHHFGWYSKGSVIVMLVCISAVSLVYFVKHLVLWVMSATFPIEKESSLYGFVTQLVNILLGISLVPLNLLIAFGPNTLAGVAIWVAIVVIILLYLFRQLKGLFISGRLLHSHLFHFFLYLCTAEIAPLLIIGKMAWGNFGIH